MDENLNVVNATQENVVDSQPPQEPEQVSQPESVPGEIATPQEEKPVQSQEQNSFYADIRRKAEADAKAQAQKEIDQFYSQQYGEYGIHSKSDYEKAVQAQQEQQQREQYQAAGLDPDMINQIINDNPIVKQANEIITKQQQDTKINAEIQDLFNEFPESRNTQIPDSVFLESINKGIPLSYAYAKYATKNALQIAEQQALQNITQNAQTSPGALSGGQAPQAASSVNKMSKSDFEQLQNEVLRGERKTL